jgi:hypothetical protein
MHNHGINAAAMKRGANSLLHGEPLAAMVEYGNDDVDNEGRGDEHCHGDERQPGWLFGDDYRCHGRKMISNITINRTAPPETSRYMAVSLEHECTGEAG